MNFRTIGWLLTVITLLSAQSCKKEELRTEKTFKVILDGKNMVPANASAATGVVEGVYDVQRRVLSYTITYAGMSPNAWHIHRESIGKNGALVLNLGTTFTSPFKGQTAQLTESQSNDLLNGMWYIDLHSTLYAAGEIRAQLIFE